MCAALSIAVSILVLLISSAIWKPLKQSGGQETAELRHVGYITLYGGDGEADLLEPQLMVSDTLSLNEDSSSQTRIHADTWLLIVSSAAAAFGVYRILPFLSMLLQRKAKAPPEAQREALRSTTLGHTPARVQMQEYVQRLLRAEEEVKKVIETVDNISEQLAESSISQSPALRDLIEQLRRIEASDLPLHDQCEQGGKLDALPSIGM